MGRRSPWVLGALVGGLILGLPAGALLFVKVPVLVVEDVTAERVLLAVQIRAGESVVVSSRHPAMRGPVSQTFAVAGDGAFLVGEQTSASSSPYLRGPHHAGDERLQELQFSVRRGADQVLVVKGRMLSLAKEARPGASVKIRVRRQFWWWRAWQK